MEGDRVVQNLNGNDGQSLFPGRFVAGTVAILAGYYFYVKFFNRGPEDKPDALVKFMLEDPIGKIFLDAKESMDKKTSEWWQSVKETLLTEELRNALDSISDVLQQLTKFDAELEIQKTRTPLFVLLGIIRRAQEEEAALGRHKLPLMVGEDIREEEDGNDETNQVKDLISELCFPEARRVAQFAIDIYDASIFGWTERSVATKFGLKEIEDIALKDFTSTEHPRFVILTDHSNQNVVLCIRGTYSIGDAILDIVCDEVPFLDGFAHHGMVDGANRILAKSMPVLRSLLLDRFPGYKLRVTGHSLGAGTAELITMLLISKTHEESQWLSKIDIKCVALAPPPVYRPRTPNQPLQEEIQQNILIFVNGNDCVPRLSLANCAWLLSALRAVDGLNLSVLDQLSIIFQKTTYKKELPLIQPIQTVKENLQKVITAMQGIDVNYQEKFRYLSHPSKDVYYLNPVYNDNNKGSSVLSVSLIRKKAKHFSHLLLMFSKMLADHFQWSYEAALNKVAYKTDSVDTKDVNNSKENVVTSNQGSSLVLI